MANKTTTETREAVESLVDEMITANLDDESPNYIHRFKIPAHRGMIRNYSNEIMQLLAKEKQDLLMSLLDKYNEVDEECEKEGYGSGFVNYVGILESWIEDFEKLAEMKEGKGEK